MEKAGAEWTGGGEGGGRWVRWGGAGGGMRERRSRDGRRGG